MRTKGSGTVEKARGKFRARMYDAAGDRLPFGTHASPEAADAALRAARLELTDSRMVSPGAVTLRGRGPGFLDRREKAGIRGIRHERNRWACYVLSSDLADEPLVEITRPMVKVWALALARRLAPQTARNALNLLRAAFGEALEAGMIAVNPCAGVKVKEAPRTVEASTWLSAAETRSLLRRVDRAELPDVAFAIATGLRQGEQRSLRWGDVHADHVVVRYGSPKAATKSGKVRRVPLLPLALSALARLEPGKADAFVFPAPRGGPRPMGRMVAHADWLGWIASAGIARRVRWHDLRHTCATLLLQGAFGGRRWSLEEVKEMLGHSSVRVTERYAKATGELAASAAREVRGLSVGSSFGEAPRKPEQSPRRGSDSNRRMTVLQGLAEESGSVHLRATVGHLRAMGHAYVDAVAAGDPFAHRVGMRLVAGVEELAEVLDLAHRGEEAAS